MGGEALPDPVALLLVNVSTAHAPAPPVPPGVNFTNILRAAFLY
jgi:hypothetical protein